MQKIASLFASLGTSLCVGMGVSILGLNDAQAGTEPAQKALAAQNSTVPNNVVQNRFFLKEGRFEITGAGGYVPNNPMVTRTSGSIFGAYHVDENFAGEAAFMYFPDLGTNDLKGLTQKLVEIAHNRSNQSDFQQPVEKMLLGATFTGRWSPVYGKINLIGENVLNFDMYFTGGLGLISSKSYMVNIIDDQLSMNPTGKATHFPVNVGLGTNLFINQSLAVKLDVRGLIYRAPAPVYNPDDPEQLNRYRTYNDIVTSVGVSYFIPQMNPRLMDF